MEITSDDARDILHKWISEDARVHAMCALPHAGVKILGRIAELTNNFLIIADDEGSDLSLDLRGALSFAYKDAREARHGSEQIHQEYPSALEITFPNGFKVGLLEKRSR